MFGINLLFVPEQIFLTEGKISSCFILCNFYTVYQSVAFVLLTVCLTPDGQVARPFYAFLMHLFASWTANQNEQMTKLQPMVRNTLRKIKSADEQKLPDGWWSAWCVPGITDERIVRQRYIFSGHSNYLCFIVNMRLSWRINALSDASNHTRSLS